jgi:hypothetical protein
MMWTRLLLSDRVVMMTNGPAARIGQDLSVDLPRPRDRLSVIDLPNYARPQRNHPLPARALPQPCASRLIQQQQEE